MDCSLVQPSIARGCNSCKDEAFAISYPVIFAVVTGLTIASGSLTRHKKGDIGDTALNKTILVMSSIFGALAMFLALRFYGQSCALVSMQLRPEKGVTDL